MGADTEEDSGSPARTLGRTDEEGGSKAVRNTAVAAGGAGCLLLPLGLAGGTVIVIVFCGLGVLLAPLIAIYLLFHGISGGGGGDTPGPDDASSVIAIFQGDGQGDLDSSTVPEDLADTIQQAGELCGAIGPIVIASQIEQASGFDASLVGQDGKQGISQLPPDVFATYGEDEDDNDRTSALDAKDSIMAQGRYMCDLADQAQEMIDANEAAGSVLDLALAGYSVGMDAVRAADGVPDTNEAQGYVAAVRAQFAKYAGVAAVPSGTSTPSGVRTALPTESLSPTA